MPRGTPREDREAHQQTQIACEGMESAAAIHARRRQTSAPALTDGASLHLLSTAPGVPALVTALVPLVHRALFGFVLESLLLKRTVDLQDPSAQSRTSRSRVGNGTHGLVEREEKSMIVVPDLVRYRQALEEEVHEKAAYVNDQSQFRCVDAAGAELDGMKLPLARPGRARE